MGERAKTKKKTSVILLGLSPEICQVSRRRVSVVTRMPLESVKMCVQPPKKGIRQTKFMPFSFEGEEAEGWREKGLKGRCREFPLSKMFRPKGICDLWRQLL